METQVIISEDRYKEFLSAEKQNIETRNTWQKWYGDRLSEKQKEYDDLLAKEKQRVNDIIEKVVEAGTHRLVILSSIKDNRKLLRKTTDTSVEDVMACSIWKVVPVDEVKTVTKYWKMLTS